MRRGFTTVELGIVLAVIAVLTTVVIMGRGFILASREAAAVQLIERLRGAARLWTSRNTGGLQYTGITAGALPGIAPGVTTPWGSTVFTVTAESNPSVSCAGDACLRLCVAMPSAVVCAETASQVPNALATDCSGSCGGGPCLCVVAR